LHNRFNDFFARHQSIINAGLGALTFLTGLAGAKFGFDALQSQQAANMLLEELIRSNQDVAESNRELAETNRQVAEALNQSNNSDGSYSRIFRTVVDLFQFGRTLFDLRRFFTDRDGGRPSGRRNPNDTDFNTPPSGSAHRDRKV